MTLNFPLLLVIAVAVCGALALVDLVLFAPRRRAAIFLRRAGERARSGGAGEAQQGTAAGGVRQVVLPGTVHRAGAAFLPGRTVPDSLGVDETYPRVGDFILVNKFAYGIRLPVLDTKVIPIGDPQRGDVMVFRYPSEPNINYIKRVVGLPGDTVRYTKEKRLYVNGELVAEKLVGEEPGTLGSVTLYQEKLGQAEHLIRKEMSRYRIEPDRQWTIPAGHYFMMGDNRDNSNDSRYWNDPKIPKDLLGMVPDRNIVGKAFAVWMSWPDPKMSNLPNFSRVGVIH